MRNLIIIITLVLCITGIIEAKPVQATPPSVLAPLPDNEATIIRLPDDSLKIFWASKGDKTIKSIASKDNGRTWSDPFTEFAVPGVTYHPSQSLLDSNGQMHQFFIIFRDGTKRNIDVWMNSTDLERKEWDTPKCIHKGRVGALRTVNQLSDGRIILGIHEPSNQPKPKGTGPMVSSVLISDDHGKTWQRSKSDLFAPIFKTYNGNNYGAVEPVILARNDNTLWMLIRTQTGWLYESVSKDRGQTWTPARPSGFYCTNSPCSFVRLKDGRVILLWHNCENPMRFDGKGIYTNRDVLHAAISSDDGRTWRGFREIYADPLRNESPPLRGDRGTSYSRGIQTADDSVIVVSGQGKGHRSIIRIDPDWLEETQQFDDFESGLTKWSVYKQFLKNGREQRIQSPKLVKHLDGKSKHDVLKICRPDEKRPDAAEWNFPLGTTGTLTVKLRIEKGYAGGSIDLNDRHYQPSDRNALHRCNFTLPIAPNGKLGSSTTTLTPDKWHTICFHWDIHKKSAQVTLDGRPVEILTMQNPTHLGICYCILRSTAATPSDAGLLIESISAEITNGVTGPMPQDLMPMEPLVEKR